MSRGLYKLKFYPIPNVFVTQAKFTLFCRYLVLFGLVNSSVERRSRMVFSILGAKRLTGFKDIIRSEKQDYENF